MNSHRSGDFGHGETGSGAKNGVVLSCELFSLQFQTRVRKLCLKIVAFVARSALSAFKLQLLSKAILHGQSQYPKGNQSYKHDKPLKPQVKMPAT